MRFLSLLSVLGLWGWVAACDPVDVEPYANAWSPTTSPEAWSPPSDNEAPNGVITVTGRLFAVPNPIIIYWNGSQSQQACAGVLVEASGSEAVTVYGESLEGAAFSGLVEPQRYPMQWGGPEGVGSGFGTGICYDPQAGPPVSGTYVVHTKDPTSPTLRVPIIVRETTEPPAMEDSSQIEGRLAPFIGPIRFNVGDAGAIVDVDVWQLGQEGVRVTAIETLTPNTHVDGVRAPIGPVGDIPLPLLMSAIDGSIPEITISVRYDPVESNPADDALLIAFDDQGEDFYHLVIPIIIR